MDSWAVRSAERELWREEVDVWKEDRRVDVLDERERMEAREEERAAVCERRE